MTDPDEPSIADAHPEDANADPIDGTKPSVSAHATVDDFSTGHGIPTTPQAFYPPLAATEDERRDLLMILQGILSNIGTDPSAVEKNTSLASQYLDAVYKKASELIKSRIHKGREEFLKRYENQSKLPPVVPTPTDVDYMQAGEDESEEQL